MLNIMSSAMPLFGLWHVCADSTLILRFREGFCGIGVSRSVVHVDGHEYPGILHAFIVKLEKNTYITYIHT